MGSLGTLNFVKTKSKIFVISMALGMSPALSYGAATTPGTPSPTASRTPSNVPRVGYPRVIPLSALQSKKDCIALIEHLSPSECSSNDCKAFIQLDPSLCDNADCKGLLSLDADLCKTEDCKAQVLGLEKKCESPDCTAIVRGLENECTSPRCKALITGNKEKCQ